MSQTLLTGLDIGTTKVVAMIAVRQDSGELKVIGVGTAPSKGLKRGVVINIESTMQSIQEAVQAAQDQAQVTISSAYAGIAGSHIRSMNSHGIVAIRGDEISQADIDRVIDAARAVAIPADQRILHILPQEFLIDSQEGIREPIGMSGVRLEAKVHIVTGAVSAAQNIVKCVERCDIHVEDVILEQLASSYSVLLEDEKELGVCMIDIGGGTTDIAVFAEGAIQHSAVIPIAGDQVTNDVAVALRTPTQHAEAIKIKHASAMLHEDEAPTMIPVPNAAASSDQRPMREVSSQVLNEVVGARYEELFTLVRNELRRSGFENVVASGLVMTGGASRVRGAVELAEQVFQMPVRLGYPQSVEGLIEDYNNPKYATCVGLLQYANQQQQAPMEYTATGMNRMLRSLKGWFEKNF